MVEREIRLSLLGTPVVSAFHGSHHLLVLLVDLLHLSTGVGQLDLQELDLLLPDGLVLEGLMLLALGLFLCLLELGGELTDMGCELLDSLQSLLMRGLHFVVALESTQSAFHVLDLILGRL